MKTIAILALLLMTTDMPGAPAVRVVRTGEGNNVAPEFHIWGGQAVEFTLEITTDEPAQHVNVRANLFQIAGTIAAPLASNLPVAQELSFPPALARVEKWKVTLPAVRQATNVELRFTTQSGAGENWQPAGGARLMVYPADVGGQLRKLIADAAKREAGQLAVFGNSEALKTALRQLHVDFDDLGDTLPGELDKSLIYLGECLPQESDEILRRGKLSGRVLIFTRDPAFAARRLLDRPQRRILVRVTLPIWPGFAHAPQRQSAFLSLLQRAFQTPPPTSHQ
ncbi:MAG: hypothetical protein WDN28_02535 [Chthoniobacter sp.]